MYIFYTLIYLAIFYLFILYISIFYEFILYIPYFIYLYYIFPYFIFLLCIAIIKKCFIFYIIYILIYIKYFETSFDICFTEFSYMSLNLTVQSHGVDLQPQESLKDEPTTRRRLVVGSFSKKSDENRNHKYICIVILIPLN